VYDLGDLVPLTVSIRDEDGVLTNASTITCTITLPDGTVATPTPLTSSTGIYTVDFSPSQPGRHSVRWVATGPTTSFNDVFNVYQGASVALIGLDEAKRHMQMSTGVTVDDEELRRCIQSATGVVERHMDQVLARRTIVETAAMGDLYGANLVMLDRHPIISLTSIVSETAVYDVADFTITDANLGIIRRDTGPYLSGDVTFSYVAGRTYIPENVLEATAIIASHLWETQRMPTLGPRSRFNPADADTLTPGGRGFAVPQRAIELLGAKPPMIA